MSDPCAEYPKSAYKAGGPEDIWGRPMHIRHLTDAEDEAGALADGWYLHPLDVPEDDESDEAPRRRGRPPKVSAE